MIKDNHNISSHQKKDLTILFNKYNLVAVYLFGSRVDGTALDSSDYDFGLLFRIIPKLDEISIVTLEIEDQASKILNSEVDIVVLNTATLENKFMIINKGVLLYCRNNNQRTDFEDITIRDYLDYKPVLELYRKEVREEINEDGFYVKL